MVNLALVVIMMQFSETKRREIKSMKEHKRRNVTASQLSLYSDLRNIWMYMRNICCYFGRPAKRVHHIHQHQHVHVHQHMLLCDQCKMLCGINDQEVSRYLIGPKLSDKIFVTWPNFCQFCCFYVFEIHTRVINSID